LSYRKDTILAAEARAYPKSCQIAGNELILAVMLDMFMRKSGLTFYEYIILLAIVVTAFLATQVYMKRGMQGRLRGLANQIHPKQYEPLKSTSTTKITRDSSSTDKENLGTFTSKGTEATASSFDLKTVEE
jgi:hypothetical protein